MRRTCVGHASDMRRACVGASETFRAAHQADTIAPWSRQTSPQYPHESVNLLRTRLLALLRSGALYTRTQRFASRKFKRPRAFAMNSHQRESAGSMGLLAVLAPLRFCLARVRMPLRCAQTSTGFRSWKKTLATGNRRRKAGCTPAAMTVTPRFWLGPRVCSRDSRRTEWNCRMPCDFSFNPRKKAVPAGSGWWKMARWMRDGKDLRCGESTDCTTFPASHLGHCKRGVEHYLPRVIAMKSPCMVAQPTLRGRTTGVIRSWPRVRL